MEERIEINGVWYIREDLAVCPIEMDDVSIANSLECTYETGDWCFTASVILKEDAVLLTDHYPDPYVLIVDKRSSDRSDWTEDSSDNPNWMIGILEGSPEAVSDAVKMFDTQGLAEFKRFLLHLVEKGWLVWNKN